MAKEVIRKFRPERPIYLNTQNTSLKTVAEVEEKVEILRNEDRSNGDYHWLCKYDEVARPIMMSFNDPREFDAFRKACGALGFTLAGSIIQNDPEDVFAEEERKANPNIKAAEQEESETDTEELTTGKVKTNRKK